LPPVNFTPGEAAAVAVALGQGEELPFRVDGRSALEKVLEAMPPEQRRRSEVLAGKVWLRNRAGARPGAAGAVEQALLREVVLVFDYADAQGRTSRRRVDPIYLGVDDGVTYLFGP
jgi:predicted DNA-binding transcriptional regulator YafY